MVGVVREIPGTCAVPGGAVTDIFRVAGGGRRQ